MKPVRALACALLLAAFGTALLPFAPTRAQDAIRVESATATPDFPNGVAFSVSADADRPIVKADLLYTKAEVETLNLESADVTPGQHVDVTLPVDFRSAYVPPGVDITYYWRLTDDSGDVTETEPKMVTWMDTRFSWEAISTAQVSVHYYTGDKTFAQTILDSAQSTIDRLQPTFGVERSRPIRIWVYDSTTDFQGSQAPNSQEWIAGTAYPELQVILAVLPDGNEREVGRVVPHEISHQMLYQATRNPFNVPPTWLDEGLAVSNQANGNEGFQGMVESAAQDGRLFSIRSLTSEFPYDPAEATLAYAESYSVVRFILSEWGDDGMAAIVAAYRQGHSHDDALMQAIGVDMDGLDARWKESLGYRGDRGVAGITNRGSEDDLGGRLAENAGSIVLISAVAISGGAVAIRRIAGRTTAESRLVA
jgi:hypothetical protein